MNLAKNKKAVTILSFIFFLVSGMLLFIHLHNLMVTNVAETSSSRVYLLFAAILILGIVLFSYTFVAAREVKIVEVHNQEKTEDEKIETIEEETQEEEKTEIDINALLEPVLPSDDLLSSKEKYTDKLLSNLANEFEIVQGVVFLQDPKDELFQPVGKYAYFNEEPPKAFKTGETLPGQVARNKQLIIIDDIPEGYVQVVSGLGTSSPKHLLIFPVLNDDKVVGIVELASFKSFDKKMEAIVPKLSEKLIAPFSSLIKE